MLLRDRLMNEQFGFALPPIDGSSPNPSVYAINYRECLSRAQVFEISNVADFFYLGSDQEVWDWFSDFPRPVPPFQLSWFEWLVPKSSNNEGELIKLDPVWRRLGYLVAVDTPGAGAPAGMRWAVNMIPFAELAAGSALMTFPILLFGINENFDPVGTDGTNHKKANLGFGFPGIDPKLMTGRKREIAQQVGQQMIGSGYPVMLALSLLNCRNVTVRTAKTPVALAKKHHKNGKDVLSSHHIIEIQPVVQIVKRETQSAGYSRKAAAIVRGHFKDYSHGNGLFGKHKGLFWWDQRIAANVGVQYELAKHVELDPQWAENLMNAGR